MKNHELYRGVAIQGFPILPEEIRLLGRVQEKQTSVVKTCVWQLEPGKLCGLPARNFLFHIDTPICEIHAAKCRKTLSPGIIGDLPTL